MGTKLTDHHVQPLVLGVWRREVDTWQGKEQWRNANSCESRISRKHGLVELSEIGFEWGPEVLASEQKPLTARTVVLMSHLSDLNRRHSSVILGNLDTSSRCIRKSDHKRSNDGAD
jgi:hypothetical protein